MDINGNKAVLTDVGALKDPVDIALKKFECHPSILNIKEKVRKRALNDLKEELKTFSKTKDFPPPKTLATQKYFLKLKIEHASLLFRVRSKIFDIKQWHLYKYANNLNCRVCNQGEETLEHILVGCSGLAAGPVPGVEDVYSDDMAVVEMLVARIKEFDERVKEDETDEQEE